MKRLLRTIGLGLALSQAAPAAAVQGEIRLLPRDQERVWVGQQVALHLELWSDGFSFGDQRFQLPEVPGGLLLQPDATTVKLSERRADGQWQGLRYTLLLYPQRAGQLSVPPFEVAFTAGAGFGSEPVAFERTTPAVTIAAVMPPGGDAEGLLVSSPGFSVDWAWQPAPGADGAVQLEVGDALTLTVERTAADVPGMVFAPLPEPVIPGLAVYSSRPEVKDSSNRGELSGRRIDRLTMVCEREGSYSISEIKFQWWDPDRESLSTRAIPILDVQVAASPVYGAGQASVRDGQTGSWGLLAGAGAVVAAALFMVWWLRPRAAAAARRRRQRRESGEPWAFRQLQAACRGNDPGQAYRAANRWLARCDGCADTLLELAAEDGSKSLRRAVTALQRRVASGDREGWSGDELAGLLTARRRQWKRDAAPNGGLPPLNPGGLRAARPPAGPAA